MKKHNLFTILAIALLAFALGSCTMVKRHYSSGFYVDKHTKRELRPAAKQEPVVVNEIPATENKTAQVIETNNTPVVETVKHEAILVPSSSLEKQTQSSTTSGETIKATSSSTKKEVTGSHYEIKKKPAEAKVSASGGKSQIVALILCIFLGPLGIHRFYLGYTGLGILYLFTLGLFGIGWIIDLILLIIPNGLTPKGQTSYK